MERTKDKNEKFQNQIGDFKKWYCETQKRNYWVLGYFGGGAVNLASAMKIGIEFQNEVGVEFGTLAVEEIATSRRFKGFWVLWSVERQQEPLPDAEKVKDFWSFAND